MQFLGRGYDKIADPDVPPVAFEDRHGMTGEAQTYRGEHKFAPEHCIAVVAAVLHRQIGVREIDAMLGELPSNAIEFWRA